MRSQSALLFGLCGAGGGRPTEQLIECVCVCVLFGWCEPSAIMQSGSMPVSNIFGRVSLFMVQQQQQQPDTALPHEAAGNTIKERP